MSRRAVLRAAVAGAAVVVPAVSGCSVDWHGQEPTDTAGTTSGTAAGQTSPSASAAEQTGAPDKPDPDVALAVAALADEQRLLDTYTAAAHRHRQLRKRLKPVRARQQRHVKALHSAVTPPPDGPPPGTPGSPHIPPQPKAAVTALRQAVTSAHDARISDCVQAVSGPLAGLLASIAAAHRVTGDEVQQWDVHPVRTPKQRKKKPGRGTNGDRNQEGGR